MRSCQAPPGDVSEGLFCARKRHKPNYRKLCLPLLQNLSAAVIGGPDTYTCNQRQTVQARPLVLARYDRIFYCVYRTRYYTPLAGASKGSH